MAHRVRTAPVAAGFVLLLAAGLPGQATNGTIKGHITLTGPPPGNSIIRMGMDPKCSAMTAGKRIVQASALVTADGSMANVFVRLEGNFPKTAVPSQPVVIDQHECVYGPRVVGMRLGQTLQIKNDDDLMHDVHTSSAVGNSFTASQPKAGIVTSFTPKKEEVMLQLGCDVHRWMIAFVGVVAHPYFAVSGRNGLYEIANVPPGTYELKTWHERFGEQTKKVTVRAGVARVVDVAYQNAPPINGSIRPK